MEELIKINDVAKNYNVTKRSLRYYEEIGLLKSIRIGPSNSRYFDSAAINKLEQILLLRSIKFTIHDISQVLLLDQADEAFEIFVSRRREIDEKIKELSYSKAVIDSFISVGKNIGIDNINIYQLLREQIYIHKDNERMINMEKSYQGDIIRMEFGVGIVPLVKPEGGGGLLDGIKEMRKKIESETSVSIPPIRVLDKSELEDMHFRVSIKGEALIDKDLALIPLHERVTEMISCLESIVKTNIEAIS